MKALAGLLLGFFVGATVAEMSSPATAGMVAVGLVFMVGIFGLIRFAFLND